jgi:transcriptional regulator with XRE-family HTH domain
MAADPVVKELMVIRLARGLSQKRVAEMAGINIETLRAAEAGTRGVSLAVVRAWVVGLQLDLVVTERADGPAPVRKRIRAVLAESARDRQ